MREGRRRRFRHGALASLSSQVLATGGQILLVPLYLWAWGAQTYGEWLTLSASVAYATVADLGFSNYVVNRLNQLHARAEHGEFLAVLHSALAFSLKIFVGVFLGLSAAAFLLPFDSWFRFEEISRGGAVTVFVLLALQVTASVPRGLILGLYRSTGEYARGVLLSNTQRLSTVLSIALVLRFGGGPVWVAVAQLLPLGAVVWWALDDLRHRHPEIRIGVDARVSGMARSFLRPSLLFLAIQGSLVLILQGSTLLVGAFFGAGTVAVFASLRTLANLVRQVSGSLSNALWPELTALAARGEWVVLRAVHRTSVKCLSTIGFAAAAFLHLVGEDVFNLWTRGRLDYDAGLMDAFLLLLVLQAPWTASSYALLATNEHAGLARRQFLAAALGLFAGAFLAPAAGVRGILWGLTGAEAIFCLLWVPRRVVQMVGDDWGEYLRDVHLRGLVVGVSLFLGVRFMPDLRALAPDLRIVLAGVYCFSLSALLAWFLWLRSQERARLVGVLLPRLRRTGESHP